MLAYILFATGLNVSVFRKYEINYLHIFELDYKFKLTHFQLWKMSLTLIFIWSLFVSFTVFELSAETTHEEGGLSSDWQSVALLLVFLLICF